MDIYLKIALILFVIAMGLIVGMVIREVKK